MRTIVIVDPDPTWPETFASLRDRVAPVVGELALSIEHVGSTAVPGLAAKPVIDMSVIVRSPADVAKAIDRLAGLGYAHLGDLGVEGREAFRAPEELPAHNLYVCPEGSIGLRNHLAVRDHLRAHPEAARAYGERKRELARRYPHDIDAYVDGKTDLILGFLRAAGLSGDELEAIERANRAS